MVGQRWPLTVCQAAALFAATDHHPGFRAAMALAARAAFEALVNMPKHVAPDPDMRASIAPLSCSAARPIISPAAPMKISPVILALMITHISAHAAGWEKLPPVPEPVAGIIAGCVNEKILVLGGTNWRGDVKRWLDNLWLFNPTTKAWHSGPKTVLRQGEYHRVTPAPKPCLAIGFWSSAPRRASQWPCFAKLNGF